MAVQPSKPEKASADLTPERTETDLEALWRRRARHTSDAVRKIVYTKCADELEAARASRAAQGETPTCHGPMTPIHLLYRCETCGAFDEQSTLREHIRTTGAQWETPPPKCESCNGRGWREGQWCG